MFIVDSHCHLNDLDYKKKHRNIDDVITKALDRNVKLILAIPMNLIDYHVLSKKVENIKNVVLACGVHPLEQKKPYDINEFHDLAEKKSVVALGETGLDYFRQPETKVQQKASFREHIRTGISINKPIIVHMRHASDDTLAILREEQAEICGGVLHCFTEEKKIAAQLLDLGFYISFSGILTFRNAEKIRQAARYIPLDRILIETDSPYLSPVPHRGKENEPAFTREIAEYLAVLKRVGIETLASITTKNFCQLFHIPMDRVNN
ncbi:YchF/TatD family DNA exonuclease [Candidatus Pantoea carbekii]|uniref:YcfH protein n=1 Tax=Candidatus Pantoea carbekii TaxID=1235990 RepID=U3U9R3_9GAMM|nr:YchF/TatD family DNA exonuclease [Candidatus Pantoea carbekii]AKC32127.1 putative deoxyribonuclease YcfH [Candidatus Pantoea carbekii]BAO00653.1 YcfH protein [Candidatus Pantoea carbekii]